MNYSLRNGAILAEVNLGEIGSNNPEEKLSYLMSQNYHNKDLVLSLKNSKIYLSLTLYDHYLDDKSAQKALLKMMSLSKNYYEVLFESFISKDSNFI